MASLTKSDIEEIIAAQLKVLNKNQAERFDKQNKTLNSALNKIDKKIEESTKSLNEIKSLFDEKIEEVEVKVNQLEREISEKGDTIERLMVKVNQLESALKAKVDIDLRAHNLIANGIPFNEKENVKQIFAALSTKLGYVNPPEAEVFRFKASDNSKRPVLIKFATEFHKNMFFSRYLKVCKALTREAIGLKEGGSQRIYVQEDLSTTQYIIDKRASALLKEGKIKKKKIRRGIVYIQRSDSAKFTAFLSIEELESSINKSV